MMRPALTIKPSIGFAAPLEPSHAASLNDLAYALAVHHLGVRPSNA
jgi:hypothetical protein